MPPAPSRYKLSIHTYIPSVHTSRTISSAIPSNLSTIAVAFIGIRHDILDHWCSGKVWVDKYREIEIWVHIVMKRSKLLIAGMSKGLGFSNLTAWPCNAVTGLRGSGC